MSDEQESSDNSKKFFMVDGSVLTSLQDLKSAAKKMSNEVFSHHVNSERNDFSLWVADSLNDPEFASELTKVKTRKNLFDAVSEKLTGAKLESRQENIVKMAKVPRINSSALPLVHLVGKVREEIENA